MKKPGKISCQMLVSFKNRKLMEIDNKKKYLKKYKKVMEKTQNYGKCL